MTSIYQDKGEYEICRDAIQIQDASNIFAVMNTLKDAAWRLRELSLNSKDHPALILLVDKIESLMGIQTFSGPEVDRFSLAYEYCRKISGVE